MAKLLTKKEIVMSKLDEILHEIHELEEKLETKVSEVVEEQTSSYTVKINLISNQLDKIENAHTSETEEIHSLKQKEGMFRLTLSY